MSNHKPAQNNNDNKQQKPHDKGQTNQPSQDKDNKEKKPGSGSCCG